MILVLSFNPSVVRTSVVDGFELNNVNKIVDERLEISDGPIHSVHTIKLLQGESMVIGFIGGPSGRYIKGFLENHKVRSDFTWMDEEIKTINKIIDSVNGTETILIDKGLDINEKDKKVFFQKLQIHIPNVSSIVLSGDIPNGVSIEDIIKIVELLKEKQKKVTLDIKDEWLSKVLKLSPSSLYLNKNSLKGLGIDISDKDIALKKCQEIINEFKIKIIVVDFDDDNICTITKNKICKAFCTKELEYNKKHIVRNGMIGTLALCQDRGYEQEKTSKLLLATGLASKLARYPKLSSRKDIDYLYNKIKIKEIMNKNYGFYRKYVD